MSSISSLAGTGSLPSAGQTDVDQFINDLKAVGTALKLGNLTAAQSALATFQQDLQGSSANSASNSPSNAPFGKNTAANSDFQSLVTALQSGDTAGAQKAYASLQTDLKAGQASRGHHHHHSGGTDPTGASAANSTAPTSAAPVLDATA